MHSSLFLLVLGMFHATAVGRPLGVKSLKGICTVREIEEDEKQTKIEIETFIIECDGTRTTADVPAATTTTENHQKRWMVFEDIDEKQLDENQIIFGHTIRTIRFTVPSLPTIAPTGTITIPPIQPVPTTVTLAQTSPSTITLPIPPIPPPRLPKPTGTLTDILPHLPTTMTIPSPTVIIPPPRLPTTRVGGSGIVSTQTSPVTIPIPKFTLPLPTITGEFPTLPVVMEPIPSDSDESNRGSGQRLSQPTLYSNEGWMSYVLSLFGNVNASGRN